MILEHLEEDLPVGWHLTHLIRLDPDWQAIINDAEYVATATGASIEEAIANAAAKAEAGAYSTLFNNLRFEPEGRPKTTITLASLGLARPMEFKRRI